MPSCPLPLVPHMTTCCLVSSQKEGASASVWTDSFSFPKLLRRLSIFSSNSARIGGTWPNFKFQLGKGHLGTKKALPKRKGFVIQLGWIKLELVEQI